MGELTDKVKAMIMSLQITSAGGDSPKINEVLQLDDSIDLDVVIADEFAESGVGDDTGFDSEIGIETTPNKLLGKETNLKTIQKMSRTQFGNLQGFSANPVKFTAQKVLGQALKFIAPIAIALLIKEGVEFIIREGLKPGRFLDRRFKRNIEEELLQFMKRTDQQKLRQGFNRIIITAGQNQRGANPNLQTNTLNIVKDRGFTGTTIGQAEIVGTNLGMGTDLVTRVVVSRGGGLRHFTG